MIEGSRSSVILLASGMKQSAACRINARVGISGFAAAQSVGSEQEAPRGRHLAAESQTTGAASCTAFCPVQRLACS